MIEIRITDLANEDAEILKRLGTVLRNIGEDVLNPSFRCDPKELNFTEEEIKESETLKDVVPEPPSPAAIFGNQPRPEKPIDMPLDPTVLDEHVALDTAGMPWDERIHSRTRSLNADGTWRLKRKANGAEVEKVSKELKKPHEQSLANVPSPPSEVPLPPSNSSYTFPMFVTLVTKALNSKKVFLEEDILPILHAEKVQDIPSLGLHLAKVPSCYLLLETLMRQRGIE